MPSRLAAEQKNKILELISELSVRRTVKMKEIVSLFKDIEIAVK